MKPALVLYEYPLNESIRTMLRLEHLLDRLDQLVPRDEAVDHHFALLTPGHFPGFIYTSGVNAGDDLVSLQGFLPFKFKAQVRRFDLFMVIE